MNKKRLSTILFCGCLSLPFFCTGSTEENVNIDHDALSYDDQMTDLDGLAYLQTRFSNTSSQFISEDSFANETSNRYALYGDDPVNRIDPLGEQDKAWNTAKGIMNAVGSGITNGMLSTLSMGKYGFDLEGHVDKNHGVELYENMGGAIVSLLGGIGMGTWYTAAWKSISLLGTINSAGSVVAQGITHHWKNAGYETGNAIGSFIGGGFYGGLTDAYSSYLGRVGVPLTPDGRPISVGEWNDLHMKIDKKIDYRYKCPGDYSLRGGKFFGIGGIGHYGFESSGHTLDLMTSSYFFGRQEARLIPLNLQENAANATFFIRNKKGPLVSPYIFNKEILNASYGKVAAQYNGKRCTLFYEASNSFVRKVMAAYTDEVYKKAGLS